MSYFIPRNYNRMVEDDWRLSVQDALTENLESIAIVHDNEVVGWKIQPRFE